MSLFFDMKPNLKNGLAPSDSWWSGLGLGFFSSSACAGATSIEAWVADNPLVGDGERDMPLPMLPVLFAREVRC